MSEFIPSITITDFKRLKVAELKQMKCCEVTSDGEYLFTFINPQTDYVRRQSEYMGEMSNTVGGKTPQEILEAMLASA